MLGRCKQQTGFTLIEIIAAFVIFALLYATVLKIYTVSLRSTVRSGGYNQALLWAQSRFDALGVENQLASGYEKGEFNEHYRWEQEVSPYEFEWQDDSVTVGKVAVVENPVELIHVRLKVLWDDDERQATFTTLRSRRRAVSD